MSKFLTTLKVEKATDAEGERPTWELLAPLIYSSDVAKQVFIVPAGFVTDLASVPRLPLAFLLTGGTANSAAVVHDFLYGKKLTTRSLADAVFREAMEVTGEPAWRRLLMWAGVRLAGWMVWNDK